MNPQTRCRLLTDPKYQSFEILRRKFYCHNVMPFNPFVPELFFLSFLRDSLRYALFVYRLIVALAMLMRNMFEDPFHNWN